MSCFTLLACWCFGGRALMVVWHWRRDRNHSDLGTFLFVELCHDKIYKKRYYLPFSLASSVLFASISLFLFYSRFWVVLLENWPVTWVTHSVGINVTGRPLCYTLLHTKTTIFLALSLSPSLLCPFFHRWIRFL